LLSPEKIHERLINLGISDAPAPNTIAKYSPKSPKNPSEKQIQSWKTFLLNHRKGIWAMDFFVVPTLYFKLLFVLVIISHDRRKIEHFAVTSNPSSGAHVVHFIYFSEKSSPLRRDVRQPTYLMRKPLGDNSMSAKPGLDR
jgi:hypothetical protein